MNDCPVTHTTSLLSRYMRRLRLREMMDSDWLNSIAGRSATFWTRRLAMPGLVGTHGLESLIQEHLSFKTYPS